jgi:4-amino-4-deoxy-L-arabinose transferase-like glycosyltransferase
VVVRILYTLRIQRPEAFIYSDMGAYVGRAQRIAAGLPLMATDFQQAIGYPMLLAFLGPNGHSLARVVNVQLIVSCLVPIAVGLLGAAAYGRRTGLLAVVFASLYFPFIEYGALFLTEVHFILCLALAFAGFFAARRAHRRGATIAFAAGGGFALSLAITLKTTAMPAAFLFFVVDGVALALARRDGEASASWRARLKPWVLRCAVVALAAAPVLAVLSRACTRANNRFCVTGKEMGSDFLLGHYGLVADIEWRAENGEMFRFGSPGALLRHYDTHAKVPFSIADGPANQAEAWRWIGAHPGEAIVLSVDHVYDTFFGSAMWPTINSGSWPYAHLSQYVFIVFLLIPTLFACARVLRRGARAAVTSRTALVVAPIAALAITVMIATGEVRYRIPFDVFFIAIACAYVVGDVERDDGVSPSETRVARSRS